MAKENIALTQAEWRIIRTVWNHEPCVAPTVQEKLFKQTRWSNSTVRTMMDRMVAKGLLSAERAKNATFYRAAITRQQAQRSELLYALKLAFNGALTPMVQCLIEARDLSLSDLQELEKLIKARKKGAKK